MEEPPPSPSKLLLTAEYRQLKPISRAVKLVKDGKCSVPDAASLVRKTPQAVYRALDARANGREEGVNGRQPLVTPEMCARLHDKVEAENQAGKCITKKQFKDMILAEVLTGPTGDVSRVPALAKRTVKAVAAKCEVVFQKPRYVEKSHRLPFSVVQEWMIKNRPTIESAAAPELLFNVDETSLQPGKAGDEKVAVTIGGTKPSATRPPKLHHCTLILGCSAAGEKVPPALILANLKKEPALPKAAQGAFLGSSESGWINSVLFAEYLTKVFIPHVKEVRATLGIDANATAVLLMDNYAAHTEAVERLTPLLESEHVVILFLLPNSTAFLQPLDRTVNRDFKSLFYRRYEVIEEEMEKARKKEDAREKVDARVIVLEAAFDALGGTATPVMVRRGWSQCGLCPFDVDAATTHECVIPAPRVTRPTHPRPIMNTLVPPQNKVRRIVLDDDTSEESWDEMEKLAAMPARVPPAPEATPATPEATPAGRRAPRKRAGQARPAPVTPGPPADVPGVKEATPAEK